MIVTNIELAARFSALGCYDFHAFRDGRYFLPTKEWSKLVGVLHNIHVRSDQCRILRHYDNRDGPSTLTISTRPPP